MKTLLSKVKTSDVFIDPFPHIIVKDALEEELFLKLVSEFPSISTINKGMENQGIDLLSSNVRIHYLAKEVLSDDTITPLWKKFIALHTSNSFLHEFIYLFKEHILQIYPYFEKEYGFFETLSSRIRKIDTCVMADVLLDAIISINTPVVNKPNSIRQAHVDLPDKLFAGLFYMRDPQDRSTGGDLELYRFKKGKPCGFKNCEVDDLYVERVKTISYEQNVLVLFLNSSYSLHGVSVRSLTEYPRYFVNLLGEVRKPLFDPLKHQESLQMKFFKKLKKQRVSRELTKT